MLQFHCRNLFFSVLDNIFKDVVNTKYHTYHSSLILEWIKMIKSLLKIHICQCACANFWTLKRSWSCCIGKTPDVWRPEKFCNDIDSYVLWKRLYVTIIGQHWIYFTYSDYTLYILNWFRPNLRTCDFLCLPRQCILSNLFSDIIIHLQGHLSTILN